MAKSKIPSTKAPAFEKSLDALQKLVARLEKGDMDLAASLTEFEHGIALARQCQETLEAAEQKVQILLGPDDAPAPYDDADEDDLFDDDDDDDN